jgi:hypothetical protein
MPPGGVFFVAAARQAEACTELRARRYLIVSTPAMAPAESQLRQTIEDAVEGALALRGALPPGAPVGAHADTIVRDQVLRARALGAAGIALAFPPLCGDAGAGSLLELDDGAVVSAWIAAAQRGSVVLLLDERDRDARILAPRRLAELASSMKAPLRVERPAPGDSPPAMTVVKDSVPPSGEVEKAVEPIPATIKEGALARADLAIVRPAAPIAEEEDPPTLRYRERPPPPVMTMPRRGVMKKHLHVEGPATSAAFAIGTCPALEEHPAEAPARADEAPAPKPPVSEASARADEAPAPKPPVSEAPARADEALAPKPPVSEAPARADEAPAPKPPVSEASARVDEAPAPKPPVSEAPARADEAPAPKPPVGEAPARADEAPPASAAPAPAAIEEPARDSADTAKAHAALAPSEPTVVARRVVNAAEWRAHAVELDKARGPKPVSVIDKLFATRYMPLLGALSRGEADGSVKAVVDTFRMNFEHSYREAFSALRVTGKRPPMVFDAPDVASRIGRLNGARAVKLLLVDAMRFDIGERVAQRLGDRLVGRAVCVDRTLLWSAIPTTTPTQMLLLSRGPEGLREAELPAEPEADIVRGRAVGTVRRERIGAREVMKLDLVEARLRNAGAAYDDRIDSLAEEVAQITIRYIETLAPRTLLFMFGDHGFRLPWAADGKTTGHATQGGVSPEEVLVAGHAWLIGGVH